LNYIIIAIIVLLSQLSDPQRSQAIAQGNGPQKGLLFQENFEGDHPLSSAHNLETGSWDYAMQIVGSPVYKGKKAVKFEIRDNQPLVKNGKRAEVTIIKALPGKDMWYSYAVYFPSVGFAKDSQREVISQWYQNGSPATSSPDWNIN